VGNYFWSAPPTPLHGNLGVAVTAAALTTSAPAPLPQIPGGTIDPGTFLDVEADLEMTCTSATPTLTLGLYIGGIGSAIGAKTLIAGWTSPVLSASAAAWPIKFRYKGRFTVASGSVAVIRGSGEVLFSTSLTAWSTNPFPVTAAARIVSTLNTQQANELDIGVTLSSVTGSPSVTCTNFLPVVHG
jgi:hypothetical protein